MQVIAEILAEYGIASTIVVVLVFIVFFLIRNSSVLQSSKTKETTVTKSKPDLHLQRHEFFTNIEFKINVDLPIEMFSTDQNRNIMFRDMMVYLFSSYHRNMLNCVNSIDEKYTGKQWLEAINKAHYNVIQEFFEECIRNAVPEPALNAFMKWYNPYINRIYQYIVTIASIPDTTAFGKTRIFLLVLELILATLCADAQDAKEINGELEGLEYKGLPL